MNSIDEIVKSKVTEEVSTATKAAEERLQESVRAAVVKDLDVLRPIEIRTEGKKKKIERALTHEKTPIVLNYISSRLPVLLVGHAGSGKTHIAVQCAQMLDLPYYSISVNEQTSKSDFLGYVDATGKIVKTNFRKAFEEGGVFIIDEIDAGNPNILTVINSALSNDMCPFPDQMVARHPDFVCVCTANTFGEGESLQYIGRNILDAATRDRFVCIFIDYSEVLEKALIPNFGKLLKALREHFVKTNTNVVISTRAGIRLETLKASQEKVTFDDAISCLNLHRESRKDVKVREIVLSHVQV